MKKILIACGSGIATSTAVANKVAALLDANGYKNQYRITQCTITEAGVNSDGADMLIATTVAPPGLACAYVSGVPFLTGMGRADTEQQILKLMAE